MNTVLILLSINQERIEKMRIGAYGGITTNSTSSSGSKKIGNVSLPNFDKFEYCTKTNSAMSNEKFKEAITEQAKKDQAAGKYNTEAARKLLKQYVSVVSPDRKKLINEGLTQIFKKSQPQPKILNLLDLMFGEVKYQKTDKGLEYAEFMDGNGEHVATYSNGGWTFYGTKDEIARETEFFSMYREAWGNAEKASKNT